MRKRLLCPLESRATGDLRLGGTWNRQQRLKNDLLWALATVAVAAARPLPLPVLRGLGAHLGSAAHALFAGARRIALANVERVFADRSEAERRALVRRCFITLGETLGETVALLRAENRPQPIVVDPEARDILRAFTAGGAGAGAGAGAGPGPGPGPGDSERRARRGVVFASAHLGPWELVAASLVAEGIPLVAVGRKSYDPRLSWLYESIRLRGGVRVLWRDDPGAAFRIVETLRSGAVLAVPMDLRSRVESRDVPFLGHRAPTPIGPARIALRTRSAVVVGSVAPSSSGGLVITASPVGVSDLEPTEDGALVLTARINAEISRRILAMPHAWVWMHERWTKGTKI